jgi:SAM-dependent methyltransferase
MSNAKNSKIIDAVRENYARIAENEGTDCGCNPTSCCGPDNEQIKNNGSLDLGYSDKQLVNLPDGADMGLGCGNPQAFAEMIPGETVLDLGSGGGIDCFLASEAVGQDGRVIGVDMTPEMISKARNNQKKGEYSNVEFRLAEIENLPVADATVDVIISNCVINLSPDKKRVFAESFRVLKPGGRLAISDIVATTELPDDAKKDLSLYSSCVSGAMEIGKLHTILNETGYVNIRIEPKDESRKFIDTWVPGTNVSDYVLSANITANKP